MADITKIMLKLCLNLSYETFYMCPYIFASTLPVHKEQEASDGATKETASVNFVFRHNNLN